MEMNQAGVKKIYRGKEKTLAICENK